MADNQRRKSLVLDFPACVTARFCSEWLLVEDLRNLDSACCESAFRTRFLGVLCYEGTVLTKRSFGTNDLPAKVLPWLNRRGISIECLDFDRILHSTKYSSISGKVCKHLKTLAVSSVSIEELNGILQYCPAVQNISMHKMEKKSSLPVHLESDFTTRSCRDVTSLSFQSLNTIKDEVLSLVGGNKLTRLKFDTCYRISKEFAKALASKLRNGNLEYLSLNRCGDITDTRLARLLKCGASLQSLVLDHCPLLGHATFVNVINTCHNLQSLSFHNIGSISSDHVTDESLALLTANCKHLRDLCIMSLPHLTDVTLRGVLQNCHSLVTLKCVKCPGFTGDGLLVPNPHTASLLEVVVFEHCENLVRVFNICEACPLLRELRLKDCYGITYGMFTHTFTFGCHLQVFSVSSWNLYGHDLDVITPGNLSHLHTLDLGHCKELTDEGMLNITRICPNLQSLTLRGCESLTNSIAHSLPVDCTQLRHLDVRQCSMITEHGLLNVTAGCTGLRHLSLAANRSISLPTLRALAAQPLFLTRIDLEGFSVDGAFFAALMELLDHCPGITVVQIQEYCTDPSKLNNAETDVFLSMMRRIYPRLIFNHGVQVHHHVF